MTFGNGAFSEMLRRAGLSEIGFHAGAGINWGYGVQI
jgi:hypothetical protein